MASKPAIILIKPQLGENIGAAARVMANFGLNDLRLVSPRDGWPNPKALEMAAHAEHIVNKARIFPNFEQAVKDLKFLYATTARAREADKRVITQRQIKLYKNTGLVFGAERTGLTNEEISLCDELISIPVNPKYKSLNLAQAVAIICYELSLRGGKADASIQPGLLRSARNDRELASKAEISSMFKHLESELDKRGFFQEKTKRAGMVNNIRNFLTRAALNGQEVRTMRGIIRSLAEHRLK